MDLPPSSLEYPRIYRTSGKWLCVNVLLSLAFSVPALGVCWLVLVAVGPNGSIGGHALSWVLSLGCVLSVLAVIASTLKSKVVLESDRIATQGLLSSRSLQRNEILGRRVARDNAGSRTGDTWLIPRGADSGEDAQNKITISNKLNADAALRGWIDSLPDLDAPERLASEAKILEGANSPAEREARLRAMAHVRESSRKSDLILTIFTGIVGILLMTLLGVGKGAAVTLCALAIGVAVSATWELRRYAWYWVTVGSMIALHLALVLLISWPSVLPTGMYHSFLFIGSVDFLIVYGLVRLVEKVMRGQRNPDSQN